jgi:hypothetical protein
LSRRAHAQTGLHVWITGDEALLRCGNLQVLQIDFYPLYK